MRAFGPWRTDPAAVNVPLDQIFNLLHREYGRDEVNALVTERLLVPSAAKTVGHEHSLVKRISSNQSGVPQIVTTNFDHLFEFGDDAGSIPIHIPPAFPDLTLGSTISGITYLHGRLVAPDATQHPYVLSSADFGRAYLSEAWATKFISGLLERYTVVLVGYQAEDPPVKYLLQGLNHDGQFDRTRLYAFDRGEPEEIEAKWRDRGVTAIAYQDHGHLWQTMEAWADRADDPRAWRGRVVASAERDPKEMSPHERGQVAHVLRSVPGAKAFADAEPSPHPEWVCVLDAFVRNAKKSSGYGEYAEQFDPVQAYGLDDDLGPISDEDYRRGTRNDNPLEWRSGDDNPHDFHRLGGRQVEGREAMPTRLWHLVRWIGNSFQSPVIAWWAARQLGLHPRLIDHIAWPSNAPLVVLEQVRLGEHPEQLGAAGHQLRGLGANDNRWKALENSLQEELQRMEQQARQRAHDKSIRLPVIVDNPYTCKAALFRIAELMNQMGLCGNDEDFSQRYLGEHADFLCLAADAQVVQLSERTKQNLRYMLRAHEKRLLAQLDEPLHRDALWVARARYNLMRFALDMFGSFVLPR